MELHAIYTSGAATEAFAQHRADRPIGQLRQAVNEVQMILDAQLIAAGNLFFMNTLLPDEKKVLIESGEINDAMIRNRLQNTAISDDERDVLEDFV